MDKLDKKFSLLKVIRILLQENEIGEYLDKKFSLIKVIQVRLQEISYLLIDKHFNRATLIL